MQKSGGGRGGGGTSFSYSLYGWSVLRKGPLWFLLVLYGLGFAGV